MARDFFNSNTCDSKVIKVDNLPAGRVFTGAITKRTCKCKSNPTSSNPLLIMVFFEKIGSLNPYDGQTWEQTLLPSSLQHIPFFGAFAGVDYDNDGNIDLIGVSADGSIITLRNNGFDSNGVPVLTELTGSANPFASLNLGASTATRRLAIRDVNGDGQEDLIFAHADGSVRYFERLNQSANNAPPSIGNAFTTLHGTSFTTSGGWTNENLYSRKLADVNGDGRADIVGFGNGNVVVSLAQQDGTFANAITVLNDSFTTAHGWNETEYARRLADVNGDGRADIVGFGADGVYVALGQNNGGFGSMTAALHGEFVYNTTWTNDNVASRYVADVNGDGRADIVGFASSAVHVALGQSNGTFSRGFTALAGGAFSVSYGWNNESRYARRVADVNGDGRADIVGFYEDRIDVSLGQSNGTFAAPLTGLSGGAFTASEGWTDDNVFSRHLEDINGDGRADIVGFGSGAITAALGKADGTFDRPFVLDNSGAFTNTRGWTDESRYARRVADVDGDGVADIVGFYTDRLHVGLNEFVAPQTSLFREAIHASGNFASTFFTTSGGWTNENLYSRKLADVNGDGRADIVGFGNGSVIVAQGQSDGTFGTAVTVLNDTFTTAHGWNETAYARRLADVNGDGRADIIGFGSDGVSVALGQNNGGFGSPIAALNREFVYNTTWTNENIHSRYVADVNGDGRADIVGFGNSDVYVALGQSNGTFSSRLTALAGGAFTASYGWNNERRYARRLADVNGDGRADIVGFHEDRIDVSLGQSNGTFAAPLTGMSGGDFTASKGWTDENVYSRHLEDINGDGRADIVGFGSGAIVAALGKADGTFDTSFILDDSGDFTNTDGWTDESRNARRVADVNGDGVADIVGFDADSVKVSLNQIITKVNPLNDIVQSSASSISADTTLALAIASGMSSPTIQTSSLNLNQELSKQFMASASSLSGVLAQLAARRAASVALKTTSWALFFGGEIVSNILAQTGHTELAGYFGDGAAPLFDIGDLGDTVAADVGEVVLQSAINLLISPVSLVAALLDQDYTGQLNRYESGTGHSSFYLSNQGVSYYNAPNGSDAGRDLITVSGTSQADILKGRLRVDGGDGDDVLVGRLTTAEDNDLRAVHQKIAAPHSVNAGMYLPNVSSAFQQKYSYELTSTNAANNNRVGRERVNSNRFPKLKTAYYPDPNNSILIGGNGNDKLFSKVTAHLDGGAHNDYIRTTYYSKTINGGTGDDAITLEINTTDTAFNLQRVEGGTGNDNLFIRGLYTPTLTLSDSSLTFGGIGTATLSGIEQITVAAGNENNTINASGFSGNALLKGGGGNDTLTASASATTSLLGEVGNDTLIGNAQGDVLVGGEGYDTLTGNGGADVFLLNTNDAAHDTITDFNQAQGDLIVIDTTAFGKLYESDLANFRIGSSNGNGEIYYGSNKLATINGSDGSNLQVGQNVIFSEYWATNGV